jgi:hypothetical protein
LRIWPPRHLAACTTHLTAEAFDEVSTPGSREPDGVEHVRGYAIMAA